MTIPFLKMAVVSSHRPSSSSNPDDEPANTTSTTFTSDTREISTTTTNTLPSRQYAPTAEMMAINTVMAMRVGVLLDAHRLGLLRCAGRGVGMAAFEELVAIHAIPFCITLNKRNINNEDEDDASTNTNTVQHIPLSWTRGDHGESSHHLRVNDPPSPPPEVDLVISHTPMQHRDLTLNYLRGIETRKMNGLKIKRLTYIFNNESEMVVVGGSQFGPGHCLCIDHVEFVGGGYDGVVSDNDEAKEEVNAVFTPYQHRHHLCTLNTIADSLLEECTLTSVTLHPTAFANVTHIGDDFMFCCSNLKTVDLSVFGKVSRIGERFLAGCELLETIKLSATTFSNVTYIGSSFVASCTSLRSINLQSLTTLTNIDSDFMAECPSLVAVEFSPSGLGKVRSVQDHFMSRCTSLAAIDLSTFIKLESIGSSFLECCTALTCVDLSPLGGSRAGDSSSSDGGRLRHVGDNFMAECSSLVAVNASSLNGVTDCSGDGMFEDCHKDLVITGMRVDHRPDEATKRARIQAVSDSLQWS